MYANPNKMKQIKTTIPIKYIIVFRRYERIFECLVCLAYVDDTDRGLRQILLNSAHWVQKCETKTCYSFSRYLWRQSIKIILYLTSIWRVETKIKEPTTRTFCDFIQLELLKVSTGLFHDVVAIDVTDTSNFKPSIKYTHEREYGRYEHCLNNINELVSDIDPSYQLE